MSADVEPAEVEHLVSVVIPIYQAERHLAGVLADLEPLTGHVTTPGGVPFRVAEVLLVHDCGPDDSARVIREMQAAYPFVRGIWLSRNFGQHAATLAGMASAGGDWIVTMDEDGQHDPAYVGGMLDVALDEQVSVVYARPTNTAPHGPVRNLASRTAKKMVGAMSGGADATAFHSYRLILGEVGRSVAAYSGSGVYLDIALGWVAGRPATAPVALRDEGADRRSGYSLRTLLSHFWRMVLTGGTRGLRFVSLLGLGFALLGVVIAIILVIRQVTHPTPVEGWTSLVVVVLICTGVILFSLGVIAEYVGVAVNMAMGKPLYLITQDPADGPLAAGTEAEPRPAWVLGGSGLLGSAVVRRLRMQGRPVQTSSVAWSDHGSALRTLLHDAARLPADWEVYWCAGAGVVGSSPAELEAEVDLLEAFLDAWRPGPGSRGMFLASSAGGVYAGATGPPFTEATPPVPISPYGHAKLRSEAVAGEFCARHGVGFLVGRLANLYGPGQDITKPQGLISQLCRAQLTRQPLSVYVSLDTLRDYLFADDAAAMVVDATGRVTERGGGHAKVLASEQAATIGAILGVLRKITRRRPPVVLGTSASARFQVRDLRLASTAWPPTSGLARTPLPAGISATLAAVGAQLRAASLSDAGRR